MKPFRSFIPPLAVMLLAASGGSSAQGVLIDKSEIRFLSKQLGVNVEGRFRKWRANVDFRPRDLAHSRTEFDIELASIDLASEESETELKRPTWFDTSRYPVAHFVSTSIKDLGGDRYDISGKLSLKGVTRDVTVPVALRKDGSGNTVAEGQFTLKRLEYKIGEGMWSDTQTVADDVVVRLRMVLPSVG